MRNATPVLPFKTRRPTRRHYFLRVNFRPFSFFTRTTHAKINPIMCLSGTLNATIPYQSILDSLLSDIFSSSDNKTWTPVSMSDLRGTRNGK